MKTFKTIACKNEENDLESYCDYIIVTIVSNWLGHWELRLFLLIYAILDTLYTCVLVVSGNFVFARAKTWKKYEKWKKKPVERLIWYNLVE